LPALALERGVDRAQSVGVSKAFTREDADASFQSPQPSARLSEARLTAYGARLARERLAELERTGSANEGALPAERLRGLLEHAEVVRSAGADHVALGARVTARTPTGGKRTVVIVTPDEVGLVPSAISAASPLAQALLGARIGDVVEVELPRGTEELTVLAIEWPC
jgi:transcription elongation GreA/GreB family factor